MKEISHTESGSESDRLNKFTEKKPKEKIQIKLKKEKKISKIKEIIKIKVII